ncbi:MAG: neutral/alkaline non-lysosomal ceramidase N-terminal domain-containing protein [Fuerstiella sp.]|nr:c-type cytochrome [Fuerstiella sp.]
MTVLFNTTWCHQLLSTCFLLSLPALLSSTGAAQSADQYNVGVAVVDITPDYPVRLNGFGNRREESEGVSQQIYARALAVSQGDQPPLVLVTLDSLGVRTAMVDEVRRRLKESDGLPPQNLALTFSHSHCTPKVNGACDNIFSMAIPTDHQKHIDRYTQELTDHITLAARKAIASRSPARLEWAVGKAGFAKNRRTAGGPVDHDLPLLVVRDADTNEPKAIYVSYACHCVTLSFNKVSGDWAGHAAAMIERRFPGCVGLVSIGAGSDQNPVSRISGDPGDNVEAAERQGIEIASEVERLLSGRLKRISGEPQAVLNTIALPLKNPPTREQLVEQTGKGRQTDRYNATTQLARLDRGEQLISEIDYPIQTWSFGDSFCMNFLAGEVCVDYALRLKSEIDRERFWLNAYCNDFGCYIPSERLLTEGGYGGGAEVPYFALPTTLKAGLEKLIVDEVHRQVPDAFHMPKGTQGVAPKSPEDSLQCMDTHDSLEVRLVAAEPQVTDPVAIDFGPDGRLWVAEMSDYGRDMYEEFEQTSRIRWLRDADGDGYFEEAKTFVDGLRFPTDVKVWRDGILICDAPDILFARDKDGDGIADVTQKLFSGFEIRNAQARVNSLRWGLDNWIYGAGGLFGGTITGHQTGEIVNCSNRDFRMNPDTGAIEPVSGRTQQGRCRNDWGDWFGCSNGNLLRAIPGDDRYSQRNPFATLSSPPGLMADTAAHTLYPPDGLVTFELSGAPGRATAACGLGIYRDSRLGAEFADDAFTCEPVHQSVHRINLSRNGHGFAGKRGDGEESQEFLSSTDRWFRPVQARTGPDGALWVVDMYRYVIEHSRWIPQSTLAELDVFAGKRRGRIYRVVPKRGNGDTKSSAKQALIPNLGDLTDGGLAQQLGSANGTIRDLAHQMLVWRSAKSVAPEIRSIASNAKRPAAQIQALATLDALRQLASADIAAALQSDDPEVVRFAVQLSEPFLNDTPKLRTSIFALARSGSARVRRQVALSIAAGGSSGQAVPDAAATLSTLIGAAEPDAHVRSAALHSISADNINPVLNAYLDRPAAEQTFGIRRNLVLLAVQIGDSDAVARALHVCLPVAGAEQPSRAATTLLAAALNRLDGRPASPELQITPYASQRLVELHRQAMATIVGADEPEAARIAAISLLGRKYGPVTTRILDADATAESFGPAQRAAAIASLISARHSGAVQRAAIMALSDTGADDTSTMLLHAYAAVGAESRLAIADELMSRSDSMLELLSALESGRLRADILDAARRNKLLSSTNTDVRTAAKRVFNTSGTSSRAAVLKSFDHVVGMDGDVPRGRDVFQKRCSTCHKLEDHGHVVGPDLLAMTNRDPQWLLTTILDPNKDVDARYVAWTAVTVDGRTASGMIVRESAVSILLREAGGKEHVIPRSEVEEFRSSERSVMPEGLERDMSAQDFSDVIAYLASFETPPKRMPGNVPKTIAPNENGALLLTADSAEIRGRDITFETEFENIGYWHDQRDFATWKVRLPKSGRYDIYINAACATASAGNQFRIDGIAESVSGTVVGTGGWNRYRHRKVGTTQLKSGVNVIVVRPNLPVKQALFDLREVRLVPVGMLPGFAAADLTETPLPRFPPAIAPFLLDESQPVARRQKVIDQRPGMGPGIISLLAAGIRTGDIEDEYRHIPWLWRVAIAVGRRNDGGEIRDVLETCVPAEARPLRDWQAVVIGGGLVNGASQLGFWPKRRLAEILDGLPDVKARWPGTLQLAAAMADDDQVRPGTRYDALRMMALMDKETAVPHLLQYLTKDTNHELQMGAVSGLADVESTDVIAPLAESLSYLAGRNRYLAIEGLLRTNERAAALAVLLNADKLVLQQKERQSLLEHKVVQIRSRAKSLFAE